MEIWNVGWQFDYDVILSDLSKMYSSLAIAVYCISEVGVSAYPSRLDWK